MIGKTTCLLFVTGVIAYLLGGSLVKYCPYQEIWWIGNMAEDFGGGLLGLLTAANMGKMRAVLALLSGDSAPAHPAPEIRKIV